MLCPFELQPVFVVGPGGVEPPARRASAYRSTPELRSSIFLLACQKKKVVAAPGFEPGSLAYETSVLAPGPSRVVVLRR